MHPALRTSPKNKLSLAPSEECKVPTAEGSWGSTDSDPQATCHSPRSVDLWRRCVFNSTKGAQPFGEFRHGRWFGSAREIKTE